MPAITIQVKGDEKLLGKLKLAARLAPSKLQKTCLKAAVLIQGEARKKLVESGTVYKGMAGGLISTLNVEELPKGAMTVTRSPYSLVFEGPQQTKWHRYPPLAPIIEWFRVKLGLTEEEAFRARMGWIRKKFPYLIAPRPYMLPAVEKNQEKIGEMFSATISEVLK